MHDAVDDAVHTARTADADERSDPGRTSAEQALAAPLLLREVRHQLAGWEPGLIDAARAAGAGRADLTEPRGVMSRQAAERRRLRVRPGADGTPGEQRVKATCVRRAADRTVTAWARSNAAALRHLAGQITSLTDLPAEARTTIVRLTPALADGNAANHVGPLTDTGPHLRRHHPQAVSFGSTGGSKGHRGAR
ncbi:type III effector protein [Streptomyces sp. NPDC001970]